MCARMQHFTPTNFESVRMRKNEVFLRVRTSLNKSSVWTVLPFPLIKNSEFTPRILYVIFFLFKDILFVIVQCKYSFFFKISVRI